MRKMRKKNKITKNDFELLSESVKNKLNKNELLKKAIFGNKESISCVNGILRTDSDLVSSFPENECCSVLTYISWACYCKKDEYNKFIRNLESQIESLITDFDRAYYNLQCRNDSDDFYW